MSDSPHKAGYAAFIGKPNAGKSTLVNALLGQKLSIITAKPQTTRKTVLGIISEPAYQIIMLDTPGLLKPGYLLQERMMEFAQAAVRDADIIIFLIDPTQPGFPEHFNAMLTLQDKKKIAVITKIDIAEPEAIEKTRQELIDGKQFDAVVTISALQLLHMEELKNLIIGYLPEHPAYYPDDIVSDSNERFFVTEIIREKILELYSEEIPYSCEVLIEEFKEREQGKDFISAYIMVERDSQKGILIGAGGKAMKKLGEESRKAIEEFLQRSVYLDLRVKVREKWRSDEKMLKAFGYQPPGE